MNTRTLLTALLFTTSFTAIAAAEQDALEELIPADAELQKLGTGMEFTEGPVWSDAEGGHLVFSDIPANQLKRWDEKNAVTTFRGDSNQANGNTRDLEGRLISCEHAARRVSVTEPDGTVRTLVDRCEGKRFNSPNDAVVKSDGSVWFTDPTYGTPKGQAKEIDGRYVYRFDPETKQVTRVAAGFDQPNGLCFSPDEKLLYVADSGKPRHIRAFAVNEDNTLSGGAAYCTIDKGVPDGIRCDERGNVWSSAGDGIHICAPDGKLIGRILVPESPANLCFGGPDGKTLFITARASLYAIRTNVGGAKRP